MTEKNDWPTIFNVSSFRTQIIGSRQVAKQGQLSPREKTGGKRWRWMVIQLRSWIICSRAYAMLTALKAKDETDPEPSAHFF